MTGAARRVVAVSLLIAASLSVTAQARAAAVKCDPGRICQAIDQPSLPAWLTLAGGTPYFAGQQFEGMVADEYGSTADADPTLYSHGGRYAQAPKVGTVINAVLAEMDGPGVGLSTAFVLQQDRTLSVLG